MAHYGATVVKHICMPYLWGSTRYSPALTSIALVPDKHWFSAARWSLKTAEQQIVGGGMADMEIRHYRDRGSERERMGSMLGKEGGRTSGA